MSNQLAFVTYPRLSAFILLIVYSYRAHRLIHLVIEYRDIEIKRMLPTAMVAIDLFFQCIELARVLWNASHALETTNHEESVRRLSHIDSLIEPPAVRTNRYKIFLALNTASSVVALIGWYFWDDSACGVLVGADANLFWLMLLRLSTFGILRAWIDLHQNPGAAPLEVGQAFVNQNTTLAANPTTGDCSICLSEFVPTSIVRVTRCHHRFHADCVDGWLFRIRQCPLCKQDVSGPPLPRRENSV